MFEMNDRGTALVNGLRRRWETHGSWLLVVASICMVVLGAVRIFQAAPHLVSDIAPWSAMDLKYRYVEVHQWFSSLPVYGSIRSAFYPPATHAILWPFMGWLSLDAARWVWLATTLVGLVVLYMAGVRASGAHTLPVALFVGLTMVSVYPVQMNIYVGQLAVHVMVFALAGFVLLRRKKGRWWEDLLVAVLLTMALVKPNLAVPFFWVLLFVPGRIRPFLFVVILYGLLTLLAASFQEQGPVALLLTWFRLGSHVSMLEGFTNFQKWLTLVGLEAWTMPASLVILSALGAWVYFRRAADIWTLLAVSAIAARLWVHHRPYDDMLLIVPIIALCRLTRRTNEEGAIDLVAALLLAANWATLHVPTWAFYSLPPPATLIIEIGQTAVWLSTLIFLVYSAGRPDSPPGAYGDTLEPARS